MEFETDIVNVIFHESSLIFIENNITVIAWAIGGSVFGMFAYVIISGILRHKKLNDELKDAWKCDDPNVPDLRKHWCRKCRGHYRFHTRGSGDGKENWCKNCDSDDIHKVTPITLYRKFCWSFNILVLLSFGIAVGIAAHFLSIKFSFTTSPIQIHYVFYGMTLFSVIILALLYRTKLAAWNEWLI